MTDIVRSTVTVLVGRSHVMNVQAFLSPLSARFHHYSLINPGHCTFRKHSCLTICAIRLFTGTVLTLKSVFACSGHGLQMSQLWLISD